MGTQKSRIQKAYKIDVGADTIEIGIWGSNRQFDWVEYSLVYNKSNQNTTIRIATTLSLPQKLKNLSDFLILLRFTVSLMKRNIKLIT